MPAGRSARDESQHFVDPEEKNIARALQVSFLVESPAQLDHQPAHSAEEPRALEPQVLAISDARPCLAQNPVKNDASHRLTFKPIADAAISVPEFLSGANRWLSRAGRLRTSQSAHRTQQRQGIVVQGQALEF